MSAGRAPGRTGRARRARPTRLAPGLLATAILACALLLGGCSAAGLDARLLDPGLLDPGRRALGDRAPVAFRAPAPSSYAVHGVDVAKYQGTIDWAALKAGGIAFAFIKATEGGDRLDGRFDENWRAAREAGVLRGAYHFFYFCRPARQQAEWFIANVPRERGALPPVLDMEWNGHSPTCAIRVPREKALAEMRVFISMIERHYGQRPIIYSTVDFQRDVLAGEFDGYDHWLRSVARHVEDVHPERDWRFWQYTATGRAPGVAGDVDLNVFHGPPRDWRRWVRRRVR